MAIYDILATSRVAIGQDSGYICWPFVVIVRRCVLDRLLHLKRYGGKTGEK